MSKGIDVGRYTNKGNTLINMEASTQNSGNNPAHITHGKGRIISGERNISTWKCRPLLIYHINKKIQYCGNGTR